MEVYIIMKKSMMNIDNFFGVILAILIIFELNVEQDMKMILNGPYGIAISLVLLVITFIFMNPIVGLLLLIYLYENVKMPEMLNMDVKEIKRSNVMNALNSALNHNENKKINEFDLELVNIKAPLIKVSENRNANFVPHYNDKLSFKSL
jgi:hypothetical protein